MNGARLMLGTYKALDIVLRRVDQMANDLLFAPFAWGRPGNNYCFRQIFDPVGMLFHRIE